VKDIVRKLCSTLLLSILLIKVSAFHAYEHSDVSNEEVEKCDLCVLILSSQQSETLPVVSMQIEDGSVLAVFDEPLCALAADGDFTRLMENSLFSRPPPQFI